MRFVLQPKSQTNIYNLMRQCGYFSEESKNTEMVFLRPIGNSASGYPRFHAFIHPVKFSGAEAEQFNGVKIDSVSRETFEINLHLDQKKPIYQGAPAHAGEYEGPVVEAEVIRIKQIAV